MLLLPMGFPYLRASLLPILLLAVAGCSDGVLADPTCTEGRSRCVAQVTLGSSFGCALLRDRSVWCWGRNDEAQLGYSTTDLCPEELPNGQTRAVACHTFPFQVVGLERAVAVTAGGAFACALRDDGTVRCWGSNSAGQLGNGLTLPSASPVAARGLSGITAIAAGARHTCAVAAGLVYCWGANDRGQLGQPTTSRQCTVGSESIACEPQPTAIDGVKGVVAISAGAAHTCARTVEGIVLCWGDGRYGQSGSGRASAMPGPSPVGVLDGDSFIEGIVDLSAGADHTCARNADGVIWCWGRNEQGQLGSAPESAVPERCSGPCSPRPLRVQGLDFRVSAMDAGEDADVDDAAMDDAAMEAGAEASVDAGRPRDAGAEDADAGDARVGVGVPDVMDVQRVRDDVVAPSMVPRAIASGGSFSCAVLDDNTVRCWGDDSSGQLGDGRRVRAPQGAVMVIATPGAASTNPLQGVSSMAGGVDTACALLGDGSLRCWGSNRSGALGIGTTSVQSGPVPVTW